MKRTSIPYTIVVLENGLREIVFEREYESTEDTEGIRKAWCFMDERGKHTRVIYRATNRTVDGYRVYRLDRRSIRYMKRARVAA